MGCLKLETIRYQGKVIEMSKNNGQTRQSNSGRNEENYVIPKSTIKVLIAVASGCATLLTVILGVAGWMAKELYDLNKKALDENSVLISDMRSSIDDIEKGLNGSEGIYARLAKLESKIDETPVIAVSEDTQQFVTSVEKNDISLSGSSITSNTCIGTDVNGNVYIAEDLIGETVLLTYQEDDKEVYFLGQYNEKYHWDGYCVMNAYNEDGTLYGISESNFEDGKRLDYATFSLNSGTEWIYTDREVTDKENTGVTIYYQNEDDAEIKNFTKTNVRRADMLYPDEYLTTKSLRMTKYYAGATVDNYFDDTTGNAYEVVYDEDGTVRMLYVGRFRDGYFNDSTGEAFSIVYSDEYSAYFCNTGNFSQGRAENPSITPITTDEIKEMTNDYTFGCELIWK